MSEERPFAPRWTWRALRKEWRARGKAPAESPLVLVALVASLLCFLRTFALLRTGGDGSSAGVVAGGLEAAVWMVLACLSFGLAGALVGGTWAPRVSLRRAPSRDLRLHAGDTTMRTVPAAPLPIRRPTRDDIVSALAGDRERPAWITSSDAVAAGALVVLFGRADGAPEPAKASKRPLASLRS